MSVRVFRVLYLALFVGMLSTTVTSAASPIRQLTQTADATNVRPTWSPDGKKIAYQSDRDGSFHIYVMDADGANTVQISSGSDVDDRHPAWSPDGSTIAVDSGDATHREIWLIDIASKRRTQVTRTGAIASFPSWSPDGKRLAYYVYTSSYTPSTATSAGQYEGTMDVFTAARDGSGVAQMTSGLASEKNSQCTFACHSVRWSPDGSRIAFSDGDLMRVLVMSAAPQQNTPPQAITPDGERSHFPTFLANGQVLYITEHLSLDQSWTDLWLQDPSAGAQRDQLAQGILAQGPFEFSNDGTQLLFASPRSGNFEIYAVTLDDAGKAALASNPNAVTVSQAASGASAGIKLPGMSTEAYILLGVAMFAVIGEVGLRVVRRRRRMQTPRS
jgi:Tol biopolymer transport system component